MKILVTRPLYYSQTLCEKIKNIGHCAEVFPVIDFLKVPYLPPLSTAIENFNQYDIAIFTSRTAVHFGIQLLKSHWSTLPSLQYAAIGASTAADLAAQGINPIIRPLAPPFESESLLQENLFQEIEGKKIIIFKGQEGRTLLKNTLVARGAEVESAECYKRILPVFDVVEKLTTWQNQPFDAIISTSNDGLKNLALLLASELNWLRKIPLVVVSTRMMDLAFKLEFKKPILALGADDASIIKVLREFKDAPK